ncbi:MAG: hypothetical protein IT168_13205 [Bryobacterales bacterium]|nr:hypothetical protein [Bryobacterales bacterium]
MNRLAVFVFPLALAIQAPAQLLTPAERSIQKAQQMIAKSPNHVAYYNALAMAFARRARETSDVAYYGKAEETIAKSLQLQPNNFEALKVKAWVLLGRHEFAAALDLAKQLNKQMPDDISIYGYLADANVELGNYPAAVDAAQWMLNLRAGNIAGLTRAAYLRELHGDISGAMDLMQMAYDSTPVAEAEDRAWLLVQMSHLSWAENNLDRAAHFANGALQLFPEYHYALGALARVRTAQGRHEEAAHLLKRRYAAAPHPENLFTLAAALHAAGRKAEAAEAFARFETAALQESATADNSNHELMEYYTDYLKQPEKALRIARMELDRRRDVFTRAGYAWALSALGRDAEADREMKAILTLGIKNPKLREQANTIALRAEAKTRASR